MALFEACRTGLQFSYRLQARGLGVGGRLNPRNTVHDTLVEAKQLVAARGLGVDDAINLQASRCCGWAGVNLQAIYDCN
jgi:hypothetical protein